MQVSVVNCRWFPIVFPLPIGAYHHACENKTLNMICKFLLVPSTMLSLRCKVVQLAKVEFEIGIANINQLIL